MLNVHGRPLRLVYDWPGHEKSGSMQLLSKAVNSPVEAEVDSEHRIWQLASRDEEVLPRSLTLQLLQAQRNRQEIGLAVSALLVFFAALIAWAQWRDKQTVIPRHVDLS